MGINIWSTMYTQCHCPIFFAPIGSSELISSTSSFGTVGTGSAETGSRERLRGLANMARTCAGIRLEGKELRCSWQLVMELFVFSWSQLD